MPATVSLSIRGSRRLIRKLRKLADRTKRRVAAKAIWAASTPVNKAMRSNVPAVLDGEVIAAAIGRENVASMPGAKLRRTIGRRRRSYAGGFVKFVAVGVKGATPIEVLDDDGRPVNLGHPIFAAQVANAIEHGNSGGGPQSFARSAFEQARREAVRQFGIKAREEIVREARRA